MDDAIEKMVQDMQLRGLIEGTQINYISRVKILQRFYGRPAEELGEEEMRDFLQLNIPRMIEHLGRAN
jgi:hypothetical protein